MVTLIALLSSGKGTWGYVNSLIKNENWDKTYLVCNEFAYTNFEPNSDKVEKILIDEKNISKSFRVISDFLRKEVKDFEIALNLVSGSGVEHMIVLASALKAGLGVRFVYLENNEVKEFELLEEKFIAKEEF